jgi:hypothetical protein
MTSAKINVFENESESDGSDSGIYESSDESLEEEVGGEMELNRPGSQIFTLPVKNMMKLWMLSRCHSIAPYRYRCFGRRRW